MMSKVDLLPEKIIGSRPRPINNFLVSMVYKTLYLSALKGFASGT